jgi:hypothetical protein
VRKLQVYWQLKNSIAFSGTDNAEFKEFMDAVSSGVYAPPNRMRVAKVCARFLRSTPEAHGRLWRGTGGEEAVAHSYRASRHQTAGEAVGSARLGNSAFSEQSSGGAGAAGPWVAPEAEFQQVLGRHSPLGSPPRCVWLPRPP